MDVSMESPQKTRKRTTAILIANPHAGSYTQNAAQIEDTVAYLNEHQWAVTLKLTQEQGDARKFAREAVQQGQAVVIAVGGDGTVNEVIQELAGHETALGVLPSGTVNVWARETGIPLNDLVAAREVLLTGKKRRIDLGKANDRYFLLMATIGFDAEVTRTVEKKKRFGVLDYILKGTWLGLSYPNFTVFLQRGKNARRVRALQVIFGNTQLYAGTIKFTWQAKCDDGLLDICIVRSLNLFGRIGMLFDFLLRRKERQQWVMYSSSQEVKVHTTQPVAVQVDGDPLGNTSQRGFPPTTFTVVPGTLTVIVPQVVPEHLFTRPPLEEEA